ncbi:MAG: hypothetical protein COA36_16240 [Desulfotalea sp.]|nr:MAG: hypothetical protein COA36_16240 [Desulfotalea sp.]
MTAKSKFKQKVWIGLIFSLQISLSACALTGFKTAVDRNDVAQYPLWLNELGVKRSFTGDVALEYKDENSGRTDDLHSEKGPQFGHLDSSLNRLLDYSVAKKNGKGRQKKKSDPAGIANATNKYGLLTRGSTRYLSRKTGTKGWNDRDSVNIIINNQQDEKVVPLQAKSAAVLSRVEKLFNMYGELTRGREVRQFGYDLARFQKSRPGETSAREIELIRNKKGVFLKSQDNKTELFATTKDFSAQFQSDEYSMLRPVLSDYILAPGDEVFVKITGPTEIAEVFSLDRNGQLFIPQIGAVNLAGRRASQIQNIISRKVKQTFNGALVEASLGRLRSIQVTVTGYIRRPGLLQVAANSSMFSALVTAGGPVKDGSLRNISLRRRGLATQRIDLYSLLLDGDWQQDPVLLPGDIIHVGPIGNTVAILSPGSNGWIYEVRDGSNLKGLAEKVGIVRSFTDVQTILVERNAKSTDREIKTLHYTEDAENFTLIDGDIFQFYATHPHSYNSVYVGGPLLRPGIYPYEEGMRVSDLLKKGRGFLLHAFLEKALLIRELGVAARFDITPEDRRGRHRKQLIWVDLSKILAGDQDADVRLARLDRLKIFTLNDRQPEPTVTIIGGVRNPGEYFLVANMSLGDLLAIAGGPSENAYDGESSIVRRRLSSDVKYHFDVGIISFNLNEVMLGEKSAGILLQTNDKIVVRQVNNLEVSVKIDGWIQFPGTYILPSGSHISDLIQFAGGILRGADLRASIFRRQRVSSIETRQLERIYATSSVRFARTRDEVTLSGHPAESFANQLSLNTQRMLFNNMGKFQTTGRIVIDMTRDSFLQSADNLALEDGDSLQVPQKMNTVMVMGRIFNPSAYLWKSGLTVEDYLNKSGGSLEDADSDHIYVVMANGEVKSAAQKGGRFELLSFIPNPGDIVFVPQAPLGRSTMAQVMDVLNMLRMTAEIGVIGASVPHLSGSSTQIDLSGAGSQQRNIIEEFRPEIYLRDRQMQNLEE